VLNPQQLKIYARERYSEPEPYGWLVSKIFPFPVSLAAGRVALSFVHFEAE